MTLARLTFATILARKVWVVWLLLLVVGTLVFPHAAPIEQDETLVEPARAQAAWILLWTALMTWGVFQGAGFGESLTRQGLGEYLSSMGVSGVSQLGQIWLACLVFPMALTALAVGLCMAFAMPGDAEEARMWVALLFQYAFLLLLVIGAVTMLAIAIATRLGAAVGYLFAAGLALYGLHGLGLIELMFSTRKDPVLETIWVISPHFHLAGLTDRLVFKSGNLATGDFLRIAAYLGGILLVCAAAALAIFRPVRK